MRNSILFSAPFFVLILGILLNSETLIFLFYTIFPIVITILVFGIVKGEVLDIRFLFISFFALYISLPAFFTVIFGSGVLLDRFSEAVFGATAKDLHFSFILHNIAIIFLFGSAFGLYLFTGIEDRKEVKPSLSSDALILFNGLYLCILLYIFFIVIDITSIFSWDYIKYHKFIAGKGLFLFWLNTLPFIIGINLLMQQTKWQKICWVLIYLILAIILVIATGKRSYIFPSMVGISMYLLHLKKIHWLKITIVIIVIYGTMHAYGFIRAFKGETDLLNQWQKGWTFVVEHKEFLINDEFSASVINSTGVINLLKKGIWDYQYGRTVIDIFPSLIPKVFYADRQEGIALLFAKKASIGRFRAGGAFGFSIIGDSYLNFGILGVVIFFILFGFLLQKLALDPYLFQNIFVFGMLPTIIFFSRTSLSGTMKSILINPAIPFILFVCFYYFTYKFITVKKTLHEV
ncbi:MAG: O-antigen polysaccharide polymerase Wzy [Candidatus Marinimicrobia bacterium]|nr:O-antigen polysaccharide polymerase Wzy [Candidatus Neomarinimicrobiota bacterium]